MADFPPNLDDGELWLPSDILPEEAVPPKFPSELTYMEELAQKLSAYALIERTQANRAKPISNFTQNIAVRPISRYGSVPVGPLRTGLGSGFVGASEPVGHRHVSGHNHNLYASGYGGFRVGLRPVYHSGPIKQPAHLQHLQVERYVQARGRGMQQQQQRQQNQGKNCFLPIRGNGSLSIGGFARESAGGTGFFFPRVAAATATGEKRKQSVKNGVKKGGGVGKKEVGLLPSPEMGLPKDWTY